MKLGRYVIVEDVVTVENVVTVADLETVERGVTVEGVLQRLPVTRAPQRFFPISKTKFWWTSIKCFHDNIVVFISCQFRGHV